MYRLYALTAMLIALGAASSATGIETPIDSSPLWAEKLQKQADDYKQRISAWQREVFDASARSIHADLAQVNAMRQAGEDFTAELDRAAKSLGPSDEIVLKYREALASLHRSRNAYDLAEQQQAMIVETQTRVDGDDDPKTLAAMEMLANDLSLLRQRERSLQVRKQIYQRRKRVRGADDFITLNSRAEYCVALMRAGQLKAGEAEYRKLIAQEDRLRPGDIYVSQYRIDLASFLQHQGRKADARREAEKAWRGFAKTLGKESSAAQNAWRMLNELGGIDP